MMRRLIVLLLLVSFTASIAMAAVDVKLAWDAMPSGEAWTAVRIYERSGTTYTKVAEASGTLTTATINNPPVGTHYYVARSFNGQQESANSNEVSVTILTTPKAPTTVTITIAVQ